MSLTTEYGPIPEITIDKDTRVNVTPHFLSANRAAEETIPTIAAGHPRLMAVSYTHLTLPTIALV